VRPLALLSVVLLAAAAGAQDGGQPYWVSTPPGASGALGQAVAAVGNGDWTAAARALQTIFDRYPASFARSGDVYRGTRAWATEILASSPPELRDEYERLFGPNAEEALRQAFATSDRKGLLEIVRTFEGTAAGLQAAVALADDALQRGRAAEARLLLTGLKRLHPSAARSPALRLRLAVAATRDHADGGPAPHGEEMTGAPPPAAPPAPDDAWPMLGGDATRTRVAARPSFERAAYSLGLDIRERLYDQPQPPDQQSYYPFRGARRDEENWPPRWRDYNPVHPVVSRGILVVSDGRRVAGYNLYSGDVLWQYADRADIENDGRTNLNGVFAPVIADGVVYVALEVPVPFTQQKLQDIPIIYYLPVRRLVALDLETGEVRWRHDDVFLDTRPESAPLRDLSVTGAPVVRGDRIYAGAVASEGTFHGYVIAVERQTGDLVYATRVSTGQQELNLFGRQLQECVPMPLTEVDGVLYLGTNLGVLAAVDALLGTPIWAAPYDTVPIPSTYYWFEAPRRWPTFANGPPLVSGNTVVALPPDSTRLIALDRRHGRLLFDRPPQIVPRDHVLELKTLHAIDGERAYVGGDRGVVAFWLIRDPARNAVPGEVAWTAGFVGDDVGTGRGFLAEDALWVPTWTAIYRIDPASGKRIGLLKRGPPDGDLNVHLVWGEGVLLTAGRRLLTARLDPDAVLEAARERARARPDDPGPLLEAADVHLALGQAKEAVDLYQRARKLADARSATTAARRAQQGLHRALLKRAHASLAEGALERAQDEFEAAVRAAPDARDRWRARRDLELALEAAKGEEARRWRVRNLRALERDHGDAIDEATGRPVRGWALQRLAGMLLTEDPRRALAVLQQLVERAPDGEDGRQANRGIAEILERHGRDLYEPYEKRARKLFETALLSGDLEALDRGLRIYANAEASGPAALELARRRIRGRDATGAARTLQFFLSEHPASTLAPEALVLMVTALEQGGSYGPAYGALLRLRTRHGAARVPRGDGTEVEAGRLAEEWLAREPYVSLARSGRRRDLVPDLRLRFAKEFSSDAADIPDLLGQIPDALRDSAVLKAGTRVRVLDGETGHERHAFEFGGEQPKGPLVFVGDRLYATTEYKVHVFDVTTGRALHHRDVPDRGRALSLVEHRGQVFLLYREKGVRGQVGLAALHPVDGSILWARLLAAGTLDPAGAEYQAVAHEDRLLLFSTQPAEMWVLDPTSGAVESRIALEPAQGAQGPLETLLLPGGRVLVGVVTRQPGQGFDYRISYSLFLLDPAAAGDAAVVWKYRPRGDEDKRLLQHLNVAGDYVVAVDETFSAVVLELESGREVKRVSRLEIPGAGADDYFDSSQPRHDSLLLLVTRSMGDRPARLSAFDLPDLRPRYSVELAEPTDAPKLVDAQGTIVVTLSPRTRGVGPTRVRLFDPLAGKLVGEFELPAPNLTWIIARVQNGFLLVSTNTNTVYAYGPR
jgi:outer membrane protein assembly factor BamB/tetratricopeptide (TPR) repeat protein